MYCRYINMDLWYSWSGIDLSNTILDNKAFSWNYLEIYTCMLGVQIDFIYGIIIILLLEISIKINNVWTMW
jgi:hypothetical protein